MVIQSFGDLTAIVFICATCQRIFCTFPSVILLQSSQPAAVWLGYCYICKSATLMFYICPINIYMMFTCDHALLFSRMIVGRIYSYWVFVKHQRYGFANRNVQETYVGKWHRRTLLPSNRQNFERPFWILPWVIWKTKKTKMLRISCTFTLCRFRLLLFFKFPGPNGEFLDFSGQSLLNGALVKWCILAYYLWDTLYSIFKNMCHL